MKTKAVINWSGGKDSALALYRLLADDKYEIKCLLTMLSQKYDRISMHGVRAELLDEQAVAIGLPLKKVYLPEMPDMSVYENEMQKVMNQLKAEGIEVSVFGDIFLEDLRKYREEKLACAGMRGHFPLWKSNTTKLVREFIELGFKTIVVCVDGKLLDESFAGRVIDKDFLSDLPANVDPCGENGEFHTFVYDGPIFKKPVKFKTGEKVYREYPAPATACVGAQAEEEQKPSGFWYCDLLPQ
jgi:uncharacterized protein (TIGR00290 family)